MHGVVSFGPFRLFAAERQLKKGDEALQLGGRALDTLIALVERAGEIVTQGELTSRVWPDVTVGEANLRVHIANLRKALGDGGEGSRYIVTVSGRGYCFVAPVTAAAPQYSTPKQATVSDWLHRLPPRLTRLIGRDDTVRGLSARLMMYRFVSIVGPAGIGKTTVAISVGHLLLDGFNGAVFFVDLAALTDAKLVATTVAQALGLMVQTQDPLRSLPDFIGDRKILLVLDNCEHVIDSAATLAERVVGGAPQTHVLTTSREALRVEGEHIHLLYALDCPPVEGDLTAATALKYPAVQLFMERATASGHDAVLNDIDAPIVATICRQLDGIPLAIELAASHAGTLGIRGIADLLDNRFSLLWRGRRTAVPRHQTLNAMLDWSYNLLSPHERAVLSRLSVFVGDFKLEAACSVASNREIDEGIVADAIASLLAKSLLSTTALYGLTYYRLLETTRIFAQTKLAEPAETNRVAERHAKYFSEFLQNDQLVQSRFGEHDLSGYAAHIGNVRAALQWTFSDDGDATLGVELAAWAAPLFIGLSLLEECGQCCERALAALGSVSHDAKLEMILQEALALASMYTHGHSEQVRVAIDRGLALAETLGDRVRQLQLLAGLNLFLNRLGDPGGSLAAAEQASVVAEAIADRSGLVWAEWMFGISDYLAGNQARAQLHFERGLTLAEELGVVNVNFFGCDHRVRALLALARVLWLRGFSDQALRIAQKTIDEAASQGQAVSICVSLMYCAPVFFWTGDSLKAAHYVEELITYARRYSLEPYRASGVALKGIIAIARGDAIAGLHLLQSAMESLHAEQYRVLITTFMGALAEGLLKTGQFEEAMSTADKAIALATSSGIRFNIPELLRVKSEILVAGHDREAARVCLTEAIAIARSQSALALELRSTMGLASLSSEEGQPEQAHRELALVYGRFVEGFETSDLKHARLLLEKLSGRKRQP